MQWVLEHLQFVIVIGGAIAYWLNQRRKAAEDAQRPGDSKRSPGRLAPTAEMSEQLERTRRIQEEIRRKIQERAGEARPQPLPEEPPPLRPAPPMIYERAEPAPERPPFETVQEQRRAEEEEATRAALERQAQLAEQLRRLQEQHAATVGRAAAFAEKTSSAAPAAARGSLLADLRNPKSVRRAVVLREVLGTPAGLR